MSADLAARLERLLGDEGIGLSDGGVDEGGADGGGADDGGADGGGAHGGGVDGGSGVARLERLTGGASRETWAFEWGERRLVLRRDPPGRSTPGGMALEAGVLGVVGRAGLRVPAVVASDDGALLGTAGLVMDRIEGEALPRRILRDDRWAGARSKLAGDVATFLAGLHAIDPDTVPELPTDDVHERYRNAYRQVVGRSPVFEATFRWLDANRPVPPSRTTIVHGDLRLGNLLVDEEGLAAVLDWELVGRGDPVEDLAWFCVRAWRFGSPLEAGGVASIDSFLDAYEAAGGPPVERARFDWWLVQKTLQWGVICLAQAAVHLSGVLRSVELATIGRRVAEQEWDLVGLLAPAATEAALTQLESAGSPGAPRSDEAGGSVDQRRPLGDVHGRPRASELVDAVRSFLTDEVQPSTSGRVSFHARVAANALGMVVRELDAAGSHEARLRAALDGFGLADLDAWCDAIADGFLDGDGQLWPALAQLALDRVSVTNPGYV